MGVLCNVCANGSTVEIRQANTNKQNNFGTHLYEGVEQVGKGLVTVDNGSRDAVEHVAIVAVLFVLTDRIQNGNGLRSKLELNGSIWGILLHHLPGPNRPISSGYCRTHLTLSREWPPAPDSQIQPF